MIQLSYLSRKIQALWYIFKEAEEKAVIIIIADVRVLVEGKWNGRIQMKIKQVYIIAFKLS